MASAMRAVFLLCLIASMAITTEAMLNAARRAAQTEKTKKMGRKGNLKSPEAIFNRQPCDLYRDELEFNRDTDNC
ncbi:hypothetical protein AC249_AIPGENE9680 [Exaiptasia diaphana]|nr:hypothetical protein AC249_AIPGENE9680 [Exaiptasia diaphana]